LTTLSSSASVQVAATIDDTRFVNKYIMLDLHTLEEGVRLEDGTRITLDYSCGEAGSRSWSSWSRSSPASASAAG
jgi:hypothetical protein